MSFNYYRYCIYLLDNFKGNLFLFLSHKYIFRKALTPDQTYDLRTKKKKRNLNHYSFNLLTQLKYGKKSFGKLVII